MYNYNLNCRKLREESVLDLNSHSDKQHPNNLQEFKCIGLILGIEVSPRKVPDLLLFKIYKQTTIHIIYILPIDARVALRQ